MFNKKFEIPLSPLLTSRFLLMISETGLPASSFMMDWLRSLICMWSKSFISFCLAGQYCAHFGFFCFGSVISSKKSWCWLYLNTLVLFMPLVLFYFLPLLTRSSSLVTITTTHGLCSSIICRWWETVCGNGPWEAKNEILDVECFKWSETSFGVPSAVVIQLALM